jgi:O-antigen ligase
MNVGINSRENLLVWLFSFFIFLFVLVQFHVVLFDFAININLADFFVMLVLSTLLLGFFYTKTPVRWKIKNFNIFALLTCIALASGWLTALISDYSVSWATTKAIGWIVILGYLYASAMLVNRLGFFAFFRFFNLLLIFFVGMLLLSDFMLFLEIARGVFGDTVHVSYLTALSGNRNALAFQILAVLSLALAFQPLYLRNLRLNQNFLLFAVIVLVCSMFLTSSRSGIATMLLLYLAAFFMRMTDWKFLFWSMSGGVLISVLVFYFPDFFYFFYDLLSVLGSDGASASVSGKGSVVMAISSVESDMLRGQLLKDSFAMWLENPFFGAGLGAFYTGSEAVYGVSIVQHNSVMWVLSEMGLFGFLIFSAFFISLLWFVFFSTKRGIRNNAVILLLLSFGAMAMFHEMLYQRIFWLFLGAVIALGLSARTNAAGLDDKAGV